MKVLITGNYGFIGSYLERRYIKEGWDVFGWDIDGIVNQKKYYKVDMMIPAEVQAALDKIMPDLILHCAGSADVNKSMQLPLNDLERNYITTENILFALKKSGLVRCRFVLFSSAAVYGDPNILPMDEKQPANPLSPYALHKRAAEEVCEFMYRNYKMDVKILRIFSVYGPGLKKQIFWDMYHKVKETGSLRLFGSGDESRDYIYIDDLVNAVYIISDKASYEDIYFNIANGEEITIREAANVFADKIGLDKKSISFLGTRREGDPINWCADICKLAKLGYSKTVIFEKGISNYIKWLKEQDNVEMNL